ncbi:MULTISPECIES: enterobactin synthetase [Streptomyces]|nr:MULTISPECIES: enterobactin synthetase [Streptomyces]
MTGRPVQTGPAAMETSWPARVGCEPPTGVVGALAALAPLVAVAGLGLGVAAVSEPCPRPAGPAEAAAAASMPPRRRLEFLAGRRAARRALRAVGLECGEIPRSGRLPVFPPGRAASISHSAGIAVAVARAPGREVPLGCDLELRPLPRAAARLFLRADEEALLADEDAPADAGEEPRTPSGDGARWSVTELFSAKEAAWKALDVPEGGRRTGPAGSLRDLRACPSGDVLRVCPRADPDRAVRVRVVRLGAGVFSYVVGRA